MRWFLLLVGLSTFGCDLFKPPSSAGDGGARDFGSPRLAPAELPFALADDLPLGNVATALNYGSTTEIGPQVGLSLFTTKREQLSQLVPDSLLAVAALPDRVVVIFPSAPDGELTVAQGGLDRPWSAQPLDAAQPLLRPQVGALDAVVDVDGTVLIAVRRRPFSLWLYRWHPDGTVERESIPSVGPSADHWSTSRCPDVRLDATAAGVALAYLAGPRAGLVWRKPGSNDWSQHFTPALEAPAGRHLDVGCVNRVLFDESGLPQLLTLVRTWDRVPGAPEPYDPLQPGTSDPAWRPPGSLPLALTGRAPPQTAALGYAMLANGALSQRVELARAEAFIGVDHPWHPGFFAFERHPGGPLASGPNVDWNGTIATIRYRTHDPKFDPQAPLPKLEYSFRVDPVSIDTPDVPDLRDLEPRSTIDHLAFDPCGGVAAWGATRARLDLARQYVEHPSVLVCLGAPLAPVRASTSAINATPAFAHGQKPYEVAVCAQGTRLSICLGGVPSPAAAPLPAAREPRLVAVEPPEGPLALDATTARFTLSRALEPGETVIAGFWDVTGARGGEVTARVEGATVTVDFPQALQPGAVYRVAFEVRSADEPGRAWEYLDGGAPVARWWTAKSAEAIDERVTPRPFPCEGQRDDAGVCLLSELKRGLAGQYDTVGINYDFAALPLGPPAVYDPQGARVTDAVAEVLVNGSTRLTWGSTLTRDAVYEVRYPEGIVTFLGTPWLPVDLTLRFKTTAAP